jgi:uncharacterized protein (TIGR03435 family)
MFRLLTSAFALPLDQISGPDWLMGQDVRFDIAAILPAGCKRNGASHFDAGLGGKELRAREV